VAGVDNHSENKDWDASDMDTVGAEDGLAWEELLGSWADHAEGDAGDVDHRERHCSWGSSCMEDLDMGGRRGLLQENKTGLVGELREKHERRDKGGKRRDGSH